MIKGSGTSAATLVTIDKRNSDAQLWWCEGKQEWHWMLIWEDGGPYGTHMHSGTAPNKIKARADIVKTILWVEDKWPSWEYFEFDGA